MIVVPNAVVSCLAGISVTETRDTQPSRISWLICLENFGTGLLTAEVRQGVTQHQFGL